MNTTDTNILKEIVREVIGKSASHTLVATACNMLDAENRDAASLKEVCVKIQKMVGLFIGTDKAHMLGKRFGEVLR